MFILNKRLYLLIFIVFLGLFFRLQSYDWGTPLLFHPDEPAIVDQAYDLIARNSWKPLKFYGTPNQLSIYSLSLFFRMLSPIYFQGEPVVETFLKDPSFYYHTGRILTAVVGSLTIVVVYLIGVEFTPLTGLLNAILFSIFPIYVSHAHYVTPDVPLVFFVTLVIYFLIKHIKLHEEKHMWIAVIVSALSLTEKYPAVANFVMTCCIYILINKQKLEVLIIRIFGFVLTFITTIFIFAPFLFIRWRFTLGWIKQEARNYHLGIEILGFFGNAKYYLNDFYHNGGLIISILAIIGVVIVVKSRKVIYLPLFLGIIYWLGLSKVALHWSRWGLPMYITPLFMAALAIDFIYTKMGFVKLKYGLSLILLISVSSQLMLIRVNLIKLDAVDTRNLALKYFQDNDISKDNSIYEGYTPMSVGISSNTEYDLSELDNEEIQYVILSSNMYYRYLKEEDDFYKKNINFYNEVVSRKLVAKFQPECLIKVHSLKIPEVRNLLTTIDTTCIIGPELKVYRL